MNVMSHRILSPQVADYAAEHGGGSFNFQSGKAVQGPGFMVSDRSTEKKSEGTSPSAEEIQEFADSRPPSVTGDARSALGVWGGVMDVSRRHDLGSEMRRASRANVQEAAYALGSQPQTQPEPARPTRINDSMTTDTINRPYGADVLTNLGPSADSGATRAFRDISSLEADTIRAPGERLFGRTGNPNDISLNEVDNDSWSATNHANPRRTREETPFRPGREDRRRDNVGDVFRTINRGRLNAARGVSMTADPTKGWHHDKNDRGEKVGPSKIKKSLPDVGERPDAEYTPDLESERAIRSFAPNNHRYREESVQAAKDLYDRLEAERKRTQQLPNV